MASFHCPTANRDVGEARMRLRDAALADTHARAGGLASREENLMALPHANLLDVISVSPLGEKLRDSVSTSLIKTGEIQLLHLVLPAHKDMPEHHVDHECTIHCLEGVVEVQMGVGVRQLKAGSVIVLPAKEKHVLRARTDCAVLVTLVLENGDAAHGGGAGIRTMGGKP
jgi:quercetin dioxygenase-like cupin family protein